MLHTIDAQLALRKQLLRIHQKCIVDQFFINVSFHVSGGSLVLLLIDQAVDYIDCSWINVLIFRYHSALGPAMAHYTLKSLFLF